MKSHLLMTAIALACTPFVQAKNSNGSTTAPESTTAAAPSKPASSVVSKARAAAKAATRAKSISAEEAATIDKYATLQDAAITNLLKLGKTLKGVKDTVSADAAAPTIKQAGENLYNIISEVEALGEPSEAMQHAIKARIANETEQNEIMEQVMVPMLSLMMQDPPCYGSDTLNTELVNLLENLKGAAGVDEEAEDHAPLQEPVQDEEQPQD